MGKTELRDEENPNIPTDELDSFLARMYRYVAKMIWLTYTLLRTTDFEEFYDLFAFKLFLYKALYMYST